MAVPLPSQPTTIKMAQPSGTTGQAPAPTTCLEVETTKPVDFQTLLSDKIFIFVVGEECTRLSVHVAALAHISEPLCAMMTNDKMEEAIKGEAVIEDADAAAFTLLVKFAYQGLCGLSDGNRSTRKFTLPTTSNCLICGKFCQVASPLDCYPFCAKEHSNLYGENLNGDRTDEMHCVFPRCKTTWKGYVQNKLLCNNHNTTTNRRQYVKGIRADKRFTYSNTFEELNFNTSTHTHAQLSDFFDTHLPTSVTVNDPVTYAKLYVLADKYMVKDLPSICLHRLHTMLINLFFSINKLVQLIDYTYANTSAAENTLNGPSDRLRNLVISFVAQNGRTLMKFPKFLALLDEGGDFAIDLLSSAYEIFDVQSNKGNRKEMSQ